MADDLFEHPRLAAIYDALESDRAAPVHIMDMLADQWPVVEDRLRRAITERAAEVARQRNDSLDRRRESENR